MRLIRVVRVVWGPHYGAVEGGQRFLHVELDAGRAWPLQAVGQLQCRSLRSWAWVGPSSIVSKSVRRSSSPYPLSGGASVTHPVDDPLGVTEEEDHAGVRVWSRVPPAIGPPRVFVSIWTVKA
jgi:hypothetical protein